MVGPSLPAPELANHVVMVLARNDKGAGFCTGTVVAPLKILTAAHCVTSAANMRVHYRDEAGQPVMLDVKRVAMNGLYRAKAPQTREKSIDLAMITLANPLPASFGPVQIGGGGDVGEAVTLAGFGVAREGQAASSGHLLKAEMRVRAPQSNVLLWLENPEGAGACTGDSGGPVFSNGQIIGVISWTEGTGGHHCGALTQAIRLSPQIDWLEREMGR